MNKRTPIRLTRLDLHMIAAPVIWMGLLGGWFGFATGHTTTGVGLVVLAVVIFPVLIEGRVGRFFEGREMPYSRLILVGSPVLLVALDGLAELVATSPALYATLGFPTGLSAVESIGFVLLAGLLLWRLVWQARRRAWAVGRSEPRGSLPQSPGVFMGNLGERHDVHAFHWRLALCSS
jgi:hypothetical protein